ncbi:S1 RNA-binding domain-containing protein [Candidatus Gracilibacteria bacterium]|nr:S1 RNA-binding domain-containing protein [Candidatus Gracilibacteria bacterium]
MIYGNDHEKSLEALKMIEQIIKEYKTGDVVNAQIFRLEAYGAFVKIDASEKEGLIHISQTGEKNKKIEEIFVIGQILDAKIKDINERGQISLTLL